MHHCFMRIPPRHSEQILIMAHYTVVQILVQLEWYNYRDKQHNAVRACYQ